MSAEKNEAADAGTPDSLPSRDEVLARIARRSAPELSDPVAELAWARAQRP